MHHAMHILDGTLRLQLTAGTEIYNSPILRCLKKTAVPNSKHIFDNFGKCCHIVRKHMYRTRYPTVTKARVLNFQSSHGAWFLNCSSFIVCNYQQHRLWKRNQKIIQGNWLCTLVKRVLKSKSGSIHCGKKTGDLQIIGRTLRGFSFCL